MNRTFIETFDAPLRGWVRRDAEAGICPAEVRGGAIVSRSPWWIDYNHAPPGLGDVGGGEHGPHAVLEQRVPAA